MPCVAHLMLVMLRLTPFVAHLMLVMVLNLPEQCSIQDLLFHLLFMPKSAQMLSRIYFNSSKGFVLVFFFFQFELIAVGMNLT